MSFLQDKFVSHSELEYTLSSGYVVLSQCPLYISSSAMGLILSTGDLKHRGQQTMMCVAVRGG